MGYNFFQIKEVSGAFSKKLDDFRNSLGAAISQGINIPFADSDVSYVLKLQNDRIRRKGLDLDYSTYVRRDGGESSRFIAASDWEDAHYHSKVCFNSTGVKRIVKRGGSVTYHDDIRSVFYGTITDVTTGSHPDKSSFFVMPASSKK